MVFMSNIEKQENKENMLSTKKFKMNTLSHMKLPNIALELEIESSLVTEQKLSLTSILIEISAVSELILKTLKEERKVLKSALLLFKVIMKLKFNLKIMLSAPCKTNLVS